MSNIILFDEEQNIVEIQYEGVNAQLLAELDVRLTDLENQTASDYFLLNAELDALQATVHNLAIMVQQNYDDIQQEIDDRENADNDLGEAFANSIILTQQMAADAIQEEAETRAAAIIAEAEARGTAIGTLETEINTDISAIAMTVEALATNVAGNTAAIILVNEAVSTETEARTTQYSALLADFSDTNAAVLQESVARADADEALASQITIIEADFDGVYAAISAEAVARASADSAQSSLITAATATANGAATAVLTEQSARIAADGSIESKYSVKIDVNGNVAGFGLISTANNGTVVSAFNFRSDRFNIYNGSTAVAPFSVSGGVVRMQNVIIQDAVIESLTFSKMTSGNLNADLIVGAGRIVWNNGAYMKVSGVGFGTSSQFLEWFGPSMAVNSCSEATAIYYLKTNGSAYFGGSLSAGTLKTSGQTSDIGATATITIGPFGTNGNPINVVLSYVMSRFGSENGTGNQDTNFPISCTVTLYRTIAPGAEAAVATLPLSGFCYHGSHIPGEGHDYDQELNGSITYVDTAGGTGLRTYRATITARSLHHIPGGQNISIVATE